MKAKPGKKHNTFLRVALAALLVWVVVSLVQLRLDISSQRAVLADLHAQIASQQRINDELAGDNANDDMYLEQQAHNRGLAKPGESIYKEAPGN